MTINYPNGSQHQVTKKESAARGMLFEHELNDSNKYYLIQDRAVIYKKPTPIQIVKVEYPKRAKAKIVEAYYQAPSTTDYNGIYKGRYIDYEAKQINAASFNYELISKHQVDHLIKVDKHGGIAFVIIYFKKIDKVYLIDINYFSKFYYDAYNGGKKKSLKASEIEELYHGHEAKIGYAPRINYLDAVDEMYLKK